MLPHSFYSKLDLGSFTVDAVVSSTEEKEKAVGINSCT